MRVTTKISYAVLALGCFSLVVPGRAFAQRRGGGGGGGQQADAPAPAADTTPAPPGNAENGKKLWTTVGCYQCHGYSAQGGSAGARLAPTVPPYSVIIKYVRAPKGEMPPYTAKVISDAQLADIYAYLKSIPKPPDAKEIPMLNEK